MSLKTLLTRNRSSILQAWQRLILETYPDDRSTFFGKEKDAFANPVGSTIFTETEGFFDGLLAEKEAVELGTFMEGTIRIRAVQDFSPSEAVGYLLLLKQAIRDALDQHLKETAVLRDLLEFESRIDRACLVAFDLYSQCRRQIGDIRIGEVKAEKERMARVLRAMNRVTDDGRWTMDDGGKRNGEP